MKILGVKGRVLTGILKTKWIRCDNQIGCLPRFPGVGIHLLNSNDVWVSFLEGFEKNFESYGPERLDSVGEPYDFDSLMHYDNQAFSKNGQNTLESLADPNRSLGNMDDFSKIDIKQLLKSYPCKAGDKKPKDKKKERSPESKSVFLICRPTGFNCTTRANSPLCQLSDSSLPQKKKNYNVPKVSLYIVR